YRPIAFTAEGVPSSPGRSSANTGLGGAPSTTSATGVPSAGPNLNAWPEQPHARTIEPLRSITKSESGVSVQGCLWLYATCRGAPPKCSLIQPRRRASSSESDDHSSVSGFHPSAPASKATLYPIPGTG